MLIFRSRRQKTVFWLRIFCVIALVSVGAWFLWQKTDKIDPSSNQGGLAEDLLAQVGKLVVLPADEEPTIATVTDLTELQKQEFFRQAKVGDKVIIYAKAGKAILYSPTANKIIEMAPLNKNMIKQ